MSKAQIQVVSDLHFEINDGNVEDAIIPSAPILLIAGDTCPVLLWSFQNFIGWVSVNFDFVFLVAGNHEYYQNNLIATDKAIRDITKTYKNVFFLQQSEVILGDVVFMGCTLWSYIPYEFKRIIPMFVNDFKVITDMNIQKYDKMFSSNVKWLQERTAHHKENGKKVVVLTHHSPVIETGEADPRISSSFSRYGNSMMDCAYASNLNVLFPSCDLWVFGHTHKKIDKVFDGCRMVSNPKGYETKAKNAFFEKALTISI